MGVIALDIRLLAQLLFGVFRLHHEQNSLIWYIAVYLLIMARIQLLINVESPAPADPAEV